MALGGQPFPSAGWDGPFIVEVDLTDVGRAGCWAMSSGVEGPTDGAGNHRDLPGRVWQQVLSLPAGAVRSDANVLTTVFVGKQGSEPHQVAATS